MLTAVLSMMGGWLLQRLPALGGFFGKLVEGFADDYRERRREEWQLQVLRDRGKIDYEKRSLDAETEKSLLLINTTLTEIKEDVRNVDSARKREVSLYSIVERTLRLGDSLKIDKSYLNFGWTLSVMAEVFASVITPMIAFTVFSMWVAWKIAVISVAMETQNVWSALISSWTGLDWEAFFAIIGYYLGYRQDKQRAASRFSYQVK